ncbi:hypothetical protein M431DRAFT_436711 [Trichoderma harzianum CBS 226.95]|uniref:Uncharacterized protein n=1 Tax=Trichoderma harzianum CBS 226.95 TaxID=983964 RepID=A0A2T4AD90_TRIHA|nr:hypothetical protein M431DRAFT_436711 [Trichoderma harzianum CBS 226.95]PTB55054.1 hypothetical protein M431DRAFT_436711 [Trichoderma harzianum CBS 226.95]
METDLLSTMQVPTGLRRIVLLFGSSSSIQPVPPNDQQDGLFLLADVVVLLAVHAVARPPLQTEKKPIRGGGERISERSLTGLNPGSCRYRYRTCTAVVSESEPVTQVLIHICATTSISAMDAAAKHHQWHFRIKIPASRLTTYSC